MFACSPQTGKDQSYASVAPQLGTCIVPPPGCRFILTRNTDRALLLADRARSRQNLEVAIKSPAGTTRAVRGKPLIPIRTEPSYVATEEGMSGEGVGSDKPKSAQQGTSGKKQAQLASEDPEETLAASKKMSVSTGTMTGGTGKDPTELAYDRTLDSAQSG
jgi:hypothetical protein